MPKVTSDAAKRAWMTYKEVMNREADTRTEEEGIRAMQLVLEDLAHTDRGHARMIRVGHGRLTVMLFEGAELLALGDGLEPQEARKFLGDLWGAPRIVGEFPPEPD